MIQSLLNQLERIKRSPLKTGENQGIDITLSQVANYLRQHVLASQKLYLASQRSYTYLIFKGTITHLEAYK